MKRLLPYILFLALPALCPAPIREHTSRMSYVPESTEQTRADQQATQVIQGVVGDTDNTIQTGEKAAGHDGSAARAVAETWAGDPHRAANALKDVDVEVQPMRKWVNAFLLLAFALVFPFATVSGLKRLADKKLPSPGRKSSSRW